MAIESDQKTFKRARFNNRWRARAAQLRTAWPFLIWLAAIGAVAYFLVFRSTVTTLTGIVDTVADPAAPLETARIMTIEVTLGQRVGAGDVLVRMDTSVVDAEIQQIKAEMQEAANSIGNFERQTLSTIKAFEDAIKDAQAAIEDLNRQEERDRALLAQLEEQQARYDELLARKLIDAATAYELKPTIAGLRGEMDAYPAMKAVEQRRLADALESRRQLFESLRLREGEQIADALRRRAADQQAIFDAALQTAIARRETHTLRATRDGIVSRIFHHPGHVVPAGEPILRIIAEKSNLVIGFLPEVNLGSVTAGQSAHVWRQSGESSRYAARVSSLAPEIDTLPARLSPLSTQLLRGRRVILELVEEHDLVPGETVQIRLLREPRNGFSTLLNRLVAERKGAL